MLLRRGRRVVAAASAATSRKYDTYTKRDHSVRAKTRDSSFVQGTHSIAGIEALGSDQRVWICPLTCAAESSSLKFVTFAKKDAALPGHVSTHNADSVGEVSHQLRTVIPQNDAMAFRCCRSSDCEHTGNQRGNGRTLSRRAPQCAYIDMCALAALLLRRRNRLRNDGKRQN